MLFCFLKNSNIYIEGKKSNKKLQKIVVFTKEENRLFAFSIALDFKKKQNQNADLYFFDQANDFEMGHEIRNGQVVADLLPSASSQKKQKS
jgi:hypothetical protein